MSKYFEHNSNFHGGAVLADDTCGSVTFCGRFGDVLTVKVDNDPEYTMSGVYEPCSSFEKW